MREMKVEKRDVKRKKNRKEVKKAKMRTRNHDKKEE